MDINTFLEKHLVATSINGLFKEYDSIKSAMVGSFQNDIIGCCFRDTYFHKGMQQKELNKTKYKNELPLFALTFGNDYILNDKHPDAQEYIDNMKELYLKTI